MFTIFATPKRKKSSDTTSVGPQKRQRPDVNSPTVHDKLADTTTTIISAVVEPRQRVDAKSQLAVHDKLIDVTTAVTTIVNLIDDEKVKNTIGRLLHKVFIDRSQTKAATRQHYDFVSYMHIIVAMTLPATGRSHTKSIHRVLKEVLAYAGCKTQKVCARESLVRPSTFCKKLTKFIDTNIIFSSVMVSKILVPLYLNVLKKGSQQDQYAELMTMMTLVHRSWIQHKTVKITMNCLKEYKKKLTNTFINDHKIGQEKWVESHDEHLQPRFSNLLEVLQTKTIVNSRANLTATEKKKSSSRSTWRTHLST
jgi:hypothetical protein